MLEKRKYLWPAAFILLSATAVSAEGNANSAVMMICHGARGEGPPSADGFLVVMEQTNSDTVDATKLLDDDYISQSVIMDIDLVLGRVRVFEDVSPYLMDGSNAQLARHLFGDAIPRGAFEEFDEVEVIVAFRSLVLSWEFDEKTGVYTQLLNYKPSVKDEEFYVNTVTDDTRSVRCEPPFLNSDDG